MPPRLNRLALCIAASVALMVGMGLLSPAEAQASGGVDARAFIGDMSGHDETMVSYDTPVELSFGAVFSSAVSNEQVTADLDLSGLTGPLSVQTGDYLSGCEKNGDSIRCSATVTVPADVGYWNFTVDLVPGTPWKPQRLGTIRLTITAAGDSDASDNTVTDTFIAVTNRQAKLVVTAGAEPHAKVGQTVTIPVRVHNDGPNVEPGYSLTSVGFIDPEHGAIAEPSSGCSISDHDFKCSGSWLMPGSTKTFNLHFKVVKCRNSASAGSYVRGDMGAETDFDTGPDLAGLMIHCDTTSSPSSGSTGTTGGSTVSTGTTTTTGANSPTTSTPATATAEPSAFPTSVASTGGLAAVPLVADSVASGTGSSTPTTNLAARPTGGSGGLIAASVAVGVVIAAGAVGLGLRRRRRLPDEHLLEEPR